MKAFKVPVLTLLALLLVAPVGAQNINVDLGTPGTEPPIDYRAAGVPGHWNKFEATDSTVYSLVDVVGASTAVTVHQIGGTEIVQGTLGGPGDPSGPDAIMLGDTLVTHTPVENCLFFNNLIPGTYEVTTYAWMPTVPETLNKVHIDTNPNNLLIGGAWPGRQTEGVSFARHYVQVTGSGFLGPHSGVPAGGDFGVGASLNGIQLRLLDSYTPLFASSLGLEWLVARVALSYDVLQGDLTTLRSTGGDFQHAASGCLSNNQAGTELGFPVDAIPPGEGRWYLVRGIAFGPYTWDSPGPNQAAPRDASIGMSPATCP